jgi:hypothetical protein
MKNRRLLVVLVTIVVAIATVLWDAVNRWKRVSDALVRRLRGTRHPPTVLRVTEDDLAGLPAPVAKYLRKVLPDPHPIITGARVTQHGVFRLPTDAWKPFDAVSHYTVTPPGFVWDARIEMVPKIHTFVRDSAVGGEATMTASIAGLLKVLDVQSSPELLEAALQRYLSEAVWFPTALLPSQGVVWTAIDDSSARVSLTVGATTVSADFHFGADGLASGVTANRYREEDGKLVRWPWSVTLSRYEERRHVLVPIKGEVAWQLPQGRLPYWRGSVVRIDYDYAG